MKYYKFISLILVVILVVISGCSRELSGSGVFKAEGEKTTSDLEKSIHQVVQRYAGADQFSGVVLVAKVGNARWYF